MADIFPFSPTQDNCMPAHEQLFDHLEGEQKEAAINELKYFLKVLKIRMKNLQDNYSDFVDSKAAEII